MEIIIRNWKKLKDSLGKLNAIFLIIAIVTFMADLICTLGPLTSWLPYSIASNLQILSVLPFIFILLLTLLSFVGFITYLIMFTFSKFKDKTKSRTVFSYMLIIAISSFSIIIHRNVRKFVFTNLAHRSASLAEAIKAYEKENNHPPKNLEALVPIYISEIPLTQISAYPNYEFEILKQERQKIFTAWYDLGTRNGTPMRGLWVFPYGKGDHSIIVIHYLEDGEIRDFYFDRLPKEIEKKPFSHEIWKNEPGKRINIIHSFYKEQFSNNMNFTELKKLLGEPNGTIEVKQSPWELRVNCGLGFLNWDVFFYWPTEDYPNQIYGGGVEKMANWAYVHE